MSDETVDVRLPDGTAGTVPASKVSELPEGSKRLSAEEAAAEKKAVALDKKYEFREGNLARAIGGGVAATGAGAARGASGGFTDYLASEFGGRDYLNELKTAFPIASTAGEAAGMVGLAAATGGAGSAAEAGLAARMGGGAVARLGAGAARTGLEMGLYEAGRSAGDQALEGKPVDFEKAAAAGIHGLALGVAGHAGIGLLGAGVSRLVGSRGAGAVEKAVVGDAAALGERAAPKEAEGGLRGYLANKAQESSDEYALQAFGGTKNQIKRINSNVEGGAGRVVADVKNELRAELGTATLPADRKALLDGVESALERRTEERSAMLAKADKAGTLAPDFENVIKAIEEKHITPNLVAREAAPGARAAFSRELGGMAANDAASTVMVPKFGAEAEVKAAQDVIERLRGGFGDKGPTFADWADSITRLGKEAKFDALTAPVASKVKQQVYGMMSEELGRSMDAAMPSMTGSFAAEYRANQGVLQSLIKSKEMLENGLGRDARNNAFGLTSRIAGIAGGAVGGLPGMAISAGVGKLVQDHGAMLASDLLERAAGALGARRVMARTEAQVAKGVAELTGTKPVETFGLGPYRSAALKLSAASYPVIRKAVERANSDPSVISNAVADHMGPAGPKMTAGVAGATAKGVAYLASKLPPSKADPYALQPQFDDADRVSDSQKSEFLRSVEAVHDPTIILTEAKKGTLTRAHVEAVKEVYPNLYDEMRVAVMESLVSSKTKLTYARRIQLGILLDLPTDKTLSPDFQKAIQGTYQASGPSDAESPPPTLSRPLNVAGSLQTATQAATEGVE